MNLELLESFGQNYPEENDGTLDCITMAITCQFNRFGTLLAVGCNDGRIVVWDFLTRGIAKIIQAHVHPVCSISWSRSGQRMVSASTDNTVSVWDILTGESDQRFRFPSPVLKVQFHPRCETEILVTPMRHAAVVVTISEQPTTSSATASTPAAPTHKIVPLDDEVRLQQDKYFSNQNDPQIVATYDTRGKHIFTGNSRGKILVFTNNAKGFKMVSEFKVTQQGSTAVKGIEFSRRGGSFLVNTADRVIRVYNTKEILELEDGTDIEADQKMQDLVNKTMWKKCCFSGDGEYVCAGSARQHALYIWERSMGNLVKILHGTKGEILLDVVWHPVRPIVASISQGVVTVWAQQQVENWSAFAPDFKELDENVDYEERESEFDLEDEDKSVQMDEEEKADIVDEIEVDKNVPIPAFCSSDEEEEDKSALLYLPIAPEIEDPEDNWVPGVDPSPSDESPHKRERGSSNYDASKENASPKKKKPKTVDIVLENAPTDEVHPMMSKSSSKDKSSLGSKRQTGRPKGKDKGKNK